MDCEKCTHHEALAKTVEDLQKDYISFKADVKKDISEVHEKINKNIQSTTEANATIKRIPEDIKEFKTEVKEDIKSFKADMKKDMEDAKKEAKQDTADVKDEIKTLTAEVKAGAAQSTKKLTWAAFILIAATTTTNYLLPRIIGIVLKKLAEGA